MWWTKLSTNGADASFNSRLIAGKRISDPVAVIVAHPDDETIGMGGRISMLESLTLIHATNGAPNEPGRLQKKGFSDVKSYSSTRFLEVDQALHTIGASPVARIRYDYPDGELVLKLMEMIEHLQLQLRDVSVVITHAYEGGHPDHDACAFATQYAIQRLAKLGFAPPKRLEFTSYFSLNGRMRVGEFWPDGQNPGSFVRLTRDQRRRKFEALKAFKTQEWVAKIFGVRREMYREAPNYDFRRPPPPQNWLYDAHGWPISGQIWLRHAECALNQLSRLDQ
jgi:LmbE family N-acetylglucosaminyl deacetylase